MSVDIYLACHACRKKLHIAQDGLSGFTFYSGEKNCMRALGQWVDEHLFLGRDHTMNVITEDACDDYERVEWPAIAAEGGKGEG